MKIKEKRLTFSEKLHRGHFIYFACDHLYTMYMDYRIASCSLNGLLCNPGDEIYPVQSLSYRVLRCLAKVIEIHKGDVFVDVGCGWGRLIGYLRRKGLGGKETFGIEINSSAANFSKLVFKHDPHVHICCANAVKCYVPYATVLLLFNPFGETVLEEFLDMIESHYHHNIRLYYLHAVHENVFNKRKSRWKLRKRQLLKPRYHIPVVLCEYELINPQKGNRNEVFKKS